MDSTAIAALAERARAGDAPAFAELLRAHEPRLLRMVELRLDSGLRRRLDPADVVQEGLLEATRRAGEWRTQPAMPVHVWLRLVVAQSLAAAQRRHLGSERRDAQREVQLSGSRSSVSLANTADAFAASVTSPSLAAQREELRARVLEALAGLEPLDREVIVLRHFEGLSNEEVALELAITPEAASKRFVRALLRLRPALGDLGAPGS